jgi:hypothetical protein
MDYPIPMEAVVSFVSRAIIGLPWPKKIAGRVGVDLIMEPPR